MHRSKVEKTENYYPVPEPVSFILKIYSSALSDNYYPQQEERTSGEI
jgi:hypothetical protein